MADIPPMVQVAMNQRSLELDDLERYEVLGPMLRLHLKGRLVIRVAISSLPALVVEASGPVNAQNVGDGPEAA